MAPLFGVSTPSQVFRGFKRGWRGRAHGRATARRSPAGQGKGRRFIRAGRHFVVYLEIGAEIVVVDVIHGRADLPRRLKALGG